MSYKGILMWGMMTWLSAYATTEDANEATAMSQQQQQQQMRGEMIGIRSGLIMIDGSMEEEEEDAGDGEQMQSTNYTNSSLVNLYPDDSYPSIDCRKDEMNSSCIIRCDDVTDFSSNSTLNQSSCDVSVRIVLEQQINAPCEESFQLHWRDALKLCEAICNTFQTVSPGTSLCPLHVSAIKDTVATSLPWPQIEAFWLTGSWSDCDSSCGDGKQSRDIWCVDAGNYSTSQNIVVLSKEFCPSDQKPASFRRCYAGSCFGVDWVVSAWSGCSDPQCHQNHETRVVMCVGKDGRIHLDSVCDSLRRPLSSRACDMVECNQDNGPTWISSSWSACSVTCGRGKQFRKVSCVIKDKNESFHLVSNRSCLESEKPNEETDCRLEKDCQGVWMASSFGKCSVSCGGGERRRYIWCLQDGRLVDKDLCAHIEVPDNIEGCNSEPCPEVIDEPVSNCSQLPFGCCSDGKTPAEDEDRVNCPLGDEPPSSESCHTLEFGCCPDQLTPAEGPFADGCPEIDSCQNSEFGCCSDGISKANGPDEDTKCSTMNDNITETVACSNASNCELVDTITENVTSCDNSTFDSSPENVLNSGTKNCADKTSAGSMSTEVPLNETTVSPPTGETSNLPANYSSEEFLASTDSAAETNTSLDGEQISDVVTAGDSFTTASSQTTDLFSQTDVFQNLNSSAESSSEYSISSHFVGATFPDDGEKVSSQITTTPGSNDCSNSTDPDGRTGAGCDSVVLLTTTEKPDLCFLPMAIGDCNEIERAWFYNDTLNQCLSFVYTGCGGNGNRFSTEHQCNSVCKSEINTPQSLATCILPAEHGPCNVPITKWHYNHNLGLCQPFTFGGCAGNDNKFDTRKECESFCSVFDICHLPVDVGGCSNSSVRYFFSPSAGKCLPFDYGGCQGNANRFLSFRDCSIVCKQAFSLQVDLCRLPSDPGPCKWFTPMFYYDPSSGSCQKFSWGGCGGNGNRFATVEKCLENCAAGNKIHPQSTSSNQSAECMLRNDPGPCKAYRPMWYYESMEKLCRRFLYGGCGGNANQFETLEGCTRHCADNSTELESFQTSPESVVYSTTPDTRSSSNGDGIACLLARDPGPCIAYRLRWYFDQLEARCLQFHYSGCEGNANNFNSSKACEAACREYIIHSIPDRLSDPCSADRDPGPCFAEFLRYHWDRNLRECRPFTYGGCQGNGNNFANQQDCYEECDNRLTHSSSSSASDSTKSREYRPGDCYEALVTGSSCSQSVRWYFDIISGDCLPFYYRGCAGSGNNFHSHDDCTSFCLKVTEMCGIFQCDLECEFGHRRGPDGCLQCICNEPCENVICGNNMECHLDNSSCTGNNCQPKPICRPSERSDACPTFSDNWIEIHGCKTECKRDSDCSGTDRCCHTGCGRTCTPVVPKEAPSIADDLQIIEVKVGDTVSIACRARGAPLPQISWYKDGNPIVGHSSSSNDVNDVNPLSSIDSISTTTTGSLIIRNVSKTLSSSSFTCRAFNSVASTTREYTIVVNVPPQIISVKPENAIVYEGESVSFECTADGDPMPNITWHRNGQKIKQTGPDQTILQIQAIQPDDHGTYDCTAENKVGSAERKSARLEVLGYLNVNVITNETNFTTDGQANIWCNVSVTTKQLYRISWRKDGIVISPSQDDRFRQNGNELIIEKLKLTDSGEYSCRVEREQDSAESSIVIHVSEADDGIPEDCTDKPWLADCGLLVQANLCRHPYYGVFCCRSCLLAYQRRP